MREWQLWESKDQLSEGRYRYADSDKFLDPPEVNTTCHFSISTAYVSLVGLSTGVFGWIEGWSLQPSWTHLMRGHISRTDCVTGHLLFWRREHWATSCYLCFSWMDEEKFASDMAPKSHQLCCLSGQATLLLALPRAVFSITSVFSSTGYLLCDILKIKGMRSNHPAKP